MRATTNERYAYDLGIHWVSQHGTDFRGSICPNLRQPIERTAGFVADNGDAVASWVGDWLTEPQQADVLAKLRLARADEYHAFLIVPSIAVAPFGVVDALWRGSLPAVRPSLPEPITDVWVVSAWRAAKGLRWSGGWSMFDPFESETESTR